MIWDEEQPKPAASRVVKLPLEPLGVAELQEYISELRAEIARAEAAIEGKQSHRGVADSFFRKP